MCARETMDQALGVEIEAELRARVRELTCLSGVARETLLDHPQAKLCELVAHLLVPAMQVPEAVVLVELAEHSAIAGGARLPAGPSINAEIEAGGSNHGRILVANRTEQPFLREERELLKAVANTLSMWVRRREAMGALRHSEERFRRLAENAPDLVYRFGLVPSPHLDYVSPSIEQLSGYTPQELYANPSLILEVIHPEDRNRLEALFATPINGQPVVLRWSNRDGTPIWTESRNYLVTDDQGSVVAVEGISRDITERIYTERALRETIKRLSDADEQRSLLLKGLVNAQEAERQRIAEDIHDDSIQVMAAVGMRLAAIRRHGVGTNPEEAIRRLEDSVRDAIGRLRNLMFDLRPPALDREGLTQTLRSYLEGTGEPDGPKLELEGSLFREPPAEARVVLYRIAQEALANARKHGSASRVTVRLEEVDDGFLIRIRDDGKGFDPRAVSEDLHHVGLLSMRERAEQAGGWLRIDSQKGGGTTVECWLPPQLNGSEAVPE